MWLRRGAGDGVCDCAGDGRGRRRGPRWLGSRRRMGCDGEVAPAAHAAHATGSPSPHGAGGSASPRGGRSRRGSPVAWRARASATPPAAAAAVTTVRSTTCCVQTVFVHFLSRSTENGCTRRHICGCVAEQSSSSLSCTCPSTIAVVVTRRTRCAVAVSAARRSSAAADTVRDRAWVETCGLGAPIQCVGFYPSPMLRTERASWLMSPADNQRWALLS